MKIKKKSWHFLFNNFFYGLFWLDAANILASIWPTIVCRFILSFLRVCVFVQHSGNWYWPFFMYFSCVYCNFIYAHYRRQKDKCYIKKNVYKLTTHNLLYGSCFHFNSSIFDSLRSYCRLFARTASFVLFIFTFSSLLLI